MLETSGLSTKFLKKETFSGSHNGMRYSIKKEDEGITVYIYAQPWSFESTPEEYFLKREFEFSDDGVQNAITWLETIYETHRKFWDKAEKDKMANMLAGKYLKLPIT